MRWLLLGLCCLAAGLAFGLRHLPPAWDPRTPLDLTAPPNLLTGAKLGWMARHPETCFAAFALSGIPVDRVPDRASEVGCGLQDVVRLAGAVRAAPGVPLVTCPWPPPGCCSSATPCSPPRNATSAVPWRACATSAAMPAAT
ncbi:hypothetical protein ACFQY5_09980 [Paeniroseomonas aquatica]|uniref:hypothetical protein n=1 Tax=Paeniroseomonas aquatica TaxID=373043 RepID=UPI003621AA51